MRLHVMAVGKLERFSAENAAVTVKLFVQNVMVAAPNAFGGIARTVAVRSLT
jgi:hypothetical protein